MRLAPILVLTLMLPDASASPPPPTRRDDVVETIHGVELRDPYRWLEDQDAPETRAWIDAQEKHAREMLGPLPERAEVRRLADPYFHSDEYTTPWQRGRSLFFMRRLVQDQLASICVRDGLHGADRVLVDPMTVDANGKASVSIASVTPDGSRMAYAVRHGGADEEEIVTIDTVCGREVAERLPMRRYLGVVLAPDGSGVYYVTYDDGPRVLHHAFGTQLAGDPVIFGEGVPEGQGIGIDVSDDGRWLVATTWHGSAGKRSEIHVKPLGSKAPAFTVVDDLNAHFSPAIAGSRLVVQTDWRAPRGRILEIDLARPDREHWRELVPESRWPLQDVSLVDHRICARYLVDVQPVVHVFDERGKLERVIEAPGFGSMSNVSGDWRGGAAFFTFSSWNEPLNIESIDVATGRRASWWRSSIPFPRDRFVVEQLWFTSTDGARVPMFVGHAKGARPSGAPTLMSGYGGFTLTQLPHFSAAMATWMLMGGVVALPSLRGGSEFGEPWHEQGMLARKQQTFDDLFAAAEHLIATGWSKPETLALRGRSNGGLLVGAAITQRPELFRAVDCGYPLLDMVRYDKFLVAKFWVSEYGSADDPEQFRWLLGYSPYHRVKQGTAYPAVLFVTGDADTRVAPLHARKMAALLQAATSSDRPILLHYDTEMGHSGGLPADKELEDLADEIGFLAWQTGLEPQRRASLR